VPAEVVPLSERLDLNAVEQEAREANDRIDRELLEQIRTGNVGLSA
jgi:hypothetical protein